MLLRTKLGLAVIGGVSATTTVLGIACLNFHPGNLPTTLSKNNTTVNQSTNLMGQADNIISELTSKLKEENSENQQLQKDLNNAKKDSNTGASSDTNYENSLNINQTLGSGLGNEFKKIAGYSYLPGNQELINNYYHIKFTKQWVAFLNYLVANNIYDHDENASRNLSLEEYSLLELNSAIYQAGPRGGGYMDNVYSRLDAGAAEMNRDPNSAEHSLPQDEVNKLNNIELPATLKNKLNTCFKVAANYCNTNDLLRTNLVGEISNINDHMSLLLTDEYLAEYYSYLANHPNLLAKPYLALHYKHQAESYSRCYSNNYNSLNNAMDRFINNLSY